MHKLKFVAPNESQKYVNVSQTEYDVMPKETQKLYIPEKNGTYKLDELIWKKLRQNWIGYNDPMSKDYVPYTITGSEAGAIAVANEVTAAMMNRDIHTYTCKSELWYQKRGIDIPLTKNSFSEKLFLGGHLMESISAQALEMQLNTLYPAHIWEVKMGEKMYQYGEKDEQGNLIAPWLIATPDGFVYCDGELEGIAEFKNIQSFSPNAKLVKQNIVPAEYYTQGSHYMMATGTKKVFYMICLGNVFPDDFKLIIEHRNEEFCNELFRVEEEFVESLHKGEKPPMDGSDGQNMKQLHDLCRRLLGNYVPDEPAANGDSSLADIVEEISFIDSDIESLEERIKALKEQKEALLVKHIFPAVGRSNELIVPIEGTSSSYKVFVKDEKITKTIDVEELKIKEPDIYKECLEVKFSSALLKKKFPKVYEQYAKQGTSLTEKKRDFCKIRLGRVS